MIKDANGIYSFGLPDALPVRFTCCICGGPAVSEIEIFDEVVCNVCYSKLDHIREEADNQYCYDKKGCSMRTDTDGDRMSEPECDGRCARCVL